MPNDFTVKSAWMMTPIFIFQVPTVIKKARRLLQDHAPQDFTVKVVLITTPRSSVHKANTAQKV